MVRTVVKNDQPTYKWKASNIGQVATVSYGQRPVTATIARQLRDGRKLFAGQHRKEFNLLKLTMLIQGEAECLSNQ